MNSNRPYRITEELVEAVQSGQILVQVAEMVLAELPDGVPEGLEGGGEDTCLVRDTDIGAGLSHGRQPRPERNLAGDEVVPTERALFAKVLVGVLDEELDRQATQSGSAFWSRRRSHLKMTIIQTCISLWRGRSGAILAAA